MVLVGCCCTCVLYLKDKNTASPITVKCYELRHSYTSEAETIKPSSQVKESITSEKKDILLIQTHQFNTFLLTQAHKSEYCLPYQHTYARKCQWCKLFIKFTWTLICMSSIHTDFFQIIGLFKPDPRIILINRTWAPEPQTTIQRGTGLKRKV